MGRLRGQDADRAIFECLGGPAVAGPHFRRAVKVWAAHTRKPLFLSRLFGLL
jgi:hypothetical protein